MNPTRIFLLDLNPLAKLGELLRAVLESSPSLMVHHLKEPAEHWQCAGYFKSFRNIVSLSQPEMIFPVLPSSVLETPGEIMQVLEEISVHVPMIVFIESENSSNVLTLMLKSGEINFIPAPLTPMKVLPVVWQLADQLHCEDIPMYDVKADFGAKQMIGKNSAFLEGMNKISIVASCNSSVLISGETGTGKELCAQLIHHLSSRAGNSFVPVNCGAIPMELAENELFGHKSGAFTGAMASKSGLIHEAEGGTLFLDEIDSLPPLVQVKVLRFLQEKTYRPLGCTKEYQADVRVIAATGLEPEQAVGSGKLRKDLYYRLNVISIKLPPLRNRREDIPLLARHFLKKHVVELNKHVVDFSPGAMHKLMFYDWPGNIRELEHVVERAVVLSKDSIIQEMDISLPQDTIERHDSFKEAKDRFVDHFERTYIKELLIEHQGNISKAAEAAHKHRRAFWQLIRKHGIDAKKYR